MTEETKPLTREAILAADDLPLTKVEVPGWGGHLFIRPMKAGDRDEFEDWAFKAGQKQSPDLARQRRARMIVACATDAEGVRLFSNEDAPKIAEKSVLNCDVVIEAISKLNRLGAKERKALAKN